MSELLYKIFRYIFGTIATLLGIILLGIVTIIVILAVSPSAAVNPNLVYILDWVGRSVADIYNGTYGLFENLRSFVASDPYTQAAIAYFVIGGLSGAFITTLGFVWLIGSLWLNGRIMVVAQRQTVQYPVTKSLQRTQSIADTQPVKIGGNHNHGSKIPEQDKSSFRR
jgi:4-amino-4-deoxy-L-arabinose transferase-like glycosyltransferase